jgi:hypothetical protein
MEKEKAANKAVEELMNRVKELFQKSAEELALEDEEMLEGQIYEESYQEDPNEVSHVEDPDRTLDEDESGLETGVTGASPPTVTSMGGSFYLGGQVQGRRP